VFLEYPVFSAALELWLMVTDEAVLGSGAGVDNASRQYRFEFFLVDHTCTS
jgi:hypothetical protein